MKKKDILTGIYMQSAANNELTQKHIEVEISDFNVCYYKDCNQFLTKTRTI